MDKRVVICSATNYSQKEFEEKSPLYRSLLCDLISQPENIDIKYENKEGLSKVYNDFILKYKDLDIILVLIHHDVSIDDFFRNYKLIQAVEQYDIVGLAGTKKYKVSSPCVWNNSPKEDWSGAVAHQNNGKIWVTTYGKMPERCMIVDGLFLALNLKSIVNKDHKFDEQFTFHHYDLDFCIQANMKGLKVGTWPIWVTHHSIGEYRNNKEWEKNEKLFIEKYS